MRVVTWNMNQPDHVGSEFPNDVSLHAVWP
jgi:hypothetical protein